MCKTCTTFSARPYLQNDMDGGVAAALIEEEAEQRACPDLDAHWRLDEAMDRAEKAEQERDEALDDAESLRRQLHDAQQDADMSRAELESEQPRPLTADDITDEMIERAGDAYCTTRDGQGYVVFCNEKLLDAIRLALHAALTEPTRPEGAEELARLIRDADVGEWDCGDLADALLATGRVRVVTEKQP